MKLTPDDLNDICRASVGAVQCPAPASLNDEQLDAFNAAGERMFFAAVEAVNTSMTQDEAFAAAHAAASIQQDADTETPISDEYTEDGTLHDYQSGDFIRRATPQESADSIEAAKSDKGAGVITVNGRSCYVSR